MNANILQFIFVLLVFVIIILFIYIIGVMRAPYVPASKLTFKDIKPYMETGDILLFKVHSIMGKVAATFDPTLFFHVAFVCIGPDGKVMLVEHDNSKTLRKDGSFFVDFDVKMRNYPNAELALLKLKKPKENNLNFETIQDLFVKYYHKYGFQKNPLGWLKMVIHNKTFYNLIGENNRYLCIEQLSLLLRDLGVFKEDINVHDLSPSKYMNIDLPFNDGYSCDGLLQFTYKLS